MKRYVLVALCLTSLALAACSPEEVDQRSGAARSEAGHSGASADAGFASGAVRGVGKSRGHLEIRRASLSSAGARDLIHVSVEFSGPGIWPRCSLADGPSRNAVRRELRRRDPPREEGWSRYLWTESLWAERESRWSDRREAETLLLEDGTLLWVFREAPLPENERADPRRTPFFARCVGGDAPHVLRDEIHVEGTPGAQSQDLGASLRVVSPGLPPVKRTL